MDSPSKNLVEGLQGFHISSPAKQEKLSVKQYLPNNDFADSKFLSFVEGSQSKSYVRRLGDWSMSYGTVQQRQGDSPQRNNNNHDNRSSFGDGFAINGNENVDNFNDENVETPQWKQYLIMQGQLKEQQKNRERSEEPHEQGEHLNEPIAKQSIQNRRDPPSDLVLTASLSDISGIPTNTFKRHGKRKNEHSNASKETQEYGEEEEEEEKDEMEEEDIDPALEARGVFDNILRKQKSNYEFPSSHRRPSQVPETLQQLDSAESSDSTTSYFGETPSSLSPTGTEFRPYNNNNIDGNNGKKKTYEKSEVEGMKLITPEEMGLVFDNVNGVWYKPAPKNQDVSSSRTLDSSTNHSQSEFTSESSVQRGTSKSQNRQYLQYQQQQQQQHRFDNNRIGGKSNNNNKNNNTTHTNITTKNGDNKSNNLEYEEEEYDDTPMDVPEINPKFLLKRHDSNKRHRSSHPDAAVDVTTVSQVNTSFQQSKKELVALLTDAIPPKGQDWLTQVHFVNLSKRALGPHMVGLDEMVPSLKRLNLSFNRLKSLQGIPPSIVELECRHNELPNCQLDALHHLETVDLSYNSINRMTGVFSESLLHLRSVNLSNNKIKKLDKDLGTSNLTTLNLSNNGIGGTIDFAKLTRGVSPDSAWFKLEEIDLSGNNIERILNLGNLPKLRVIRLDDNPLQELIEKNSSNQLRTLSVLRTNGQLKRISIVTNDKHHPSSSSFPFHRLRILRCDALKSARQWKQLPRTLEEISIQDGDTHKIPHWDIIPGSLRVLTLSRIKGLSQLPKNFASRLPSLQELNLRGNELVSCYSLIQSLPTLCLVTLDLRENPLTRGGKSKDVTRVVRMACNRLSELRI